MVAAAFLFYIDGYNFFLNCKNRIIKLNSIPKKHEIDFPYSFHYYGCFHDLLNIKPNSINKEGIFIENRTASSLTQQEFQTLTKYGTVRFPMEEPLESVIDKELKSKYFLSLTRGVIRSPIWGSGMIEAIACGCLAFGDPNDYTNKDTFNSFSSISSFEEFMKKINFLESNPEKYRIELERQRRQINYLCFTRPIKEILDKSRTLNRNIAYFN